MAGAAMQPILQAPELTRSQAFLKRLEGLPNGEKVRDCIQCGMCVGVCPHGYAMEYAPRRIIAALRADRLEDVYRSESIWLCVSCYNCAFRCPSGIPLSDRLLAMIRVDLLMAGVGVPKELQTAFERTTRYGNPFGESAKKRDAWTKEAGVKVRVLKPGDSSDVLWHVGCFASYNKANQKDTVSMARLLTTLGVDFGIMGPDEWCSGDLPCTAVGEEGLFNMLYEHNSGQFADRSFNEILVGDPHAYNALHKEYPRLGTAYPVSHYTQFFEERIPELSKRMKKRLDLKVTYHDACCLGRRNGVYDPPRALLEAIPGVKLVEMSRNKENSLCCGGGGGAMWLDSYIWERTRTPLSILRVQEAAKTGADVLAVSCPLEVPRFEDAIKTAGLEGRLRVREVSHMLADAMGLVGGV